MPPRRDKKDPPAPVNPPRPPTTNSPPRPPTANPPSTPLPKTNKQPSPPGAPEKRTSSPPKAVPLPIRQPHGQTPPSNQPTRPTTPAARESQGMGGGPSTPKMTGTPPRPASGSATVKPAPAGVRRTPPSATGQSPPERLQQLPSRVLLPGPPLHPTPGSNAFTVLQALTAPLPAYKLASDFDHTLGNHTSSGLVAATKPPRFWTEVSVDRYLKVADNYLGTGVQSKLNQHYVPSVEPTFRVRREADVIAYAATHLTYTVNMAIGNIFVDAIESASEVEAKSCRPDYVWRTAGSKGADELFAILEMKIHGGIKPDIFHQATETYALAADQAAEQQGRLAPDTFFSGGGTGAYPAIQQMSNYAHNEIFDTRYVSLFDGIYLFLGIFSEGTNGVPALKGTLLPCRGDEGRHARKALLGWLIEAKMEKTNGHNHFVGRVPRDLPPRGDGPGQAHRKK